MQDSTERLIQAINELNETMKAVIIALNEEGEDEPPQTNYLDGTPL